MKKMMSQVTITAGSVFSQVSCYLGHVLPCICFPHVCKCARCLSFLESLYSVCSAPVRADNHQMAVPTSCVLPALVYPSWLKITVTYLGAPSLNSVMFLMVPELLHNTYHKCNNLFTYKHLVYQLPRYKCKEKMDTYSPSLQIY